MLPKQHILFHFLKELDIPFTNHHLKELTTGIPYSNQLFGIEAILQDRYKVRCECLRIEKTDVFKLDTPFMVQMDSPRNRLVLVTKVQADEFSLIYDSTDFIYKKEDFFKLWDGIVLLAEPKETSREEKYWQNLLTELFTGFRMPLIITGSVMLMMYFGNANLIDIFRSGWISIALFFSYVLGIVLSSLLLSQSIGNSDTFVEKVCRSAGNNGCTKILQGNASKLFGLISWSEIGFLYFVGSFLSFLFIKQSVGILATISVLVLPYTFWSIYYQWKIAKEWCVFCISVQATLWITFFLYLPVYFSPFPLFAVDIYQFFNIVTYFLVPSILLWLTIPLAKSYHALDGVTRQFKMLKFNEQIVKSSIRLHAPVDTTGGSTIIFGNLDAAFAITIITDLHCPHCIEAHTHLKELLQLYRERVSIKIIFQTAKLLVNEADDLLNVKFNEIKYIISLYKHYDLVTAEAAFHQWFDRKNGNYKELVEMYPIPNDIRGVDQEIINHSRWLKKVDLTGTPTFFINQHYLPRWYDAADLKHLVLTVNDLED